MQLVVGCGRNRRTHTKQGQGLGIAGIWQDEQTRVPLETRDLSDFTRATFFATSR